MMTHAFRSDFFAVAARLKVMLHGTIRNDDFQRNRALQCLNNAVTIRNKVATLAVLR